MATTFEARWRYLCYFTYLGKVWDKVFLEEVDEDEVDDDDEECHDGRGHAGDGVAGAAVAALSLARGGGAGRGEHGDEQGEPEMKVGYSAYRIL